MKLKINGVVVDGPNEETLYLPHKDQIIPFHARAIMDFEEFETQCPPPKPPATLTPKGREENENDPGYKVEMEKWNEKRLAWMVLESLKPSDIAWEKVDREKPGTWVKWREELQEAGLSQTQIGRVVQLVMEVNCLDEEKLKWAREVFIHGQQAEAAN